MSLILSRLSKPGYSVEEVQFEESLYFEEKDYCELNELNRFGHRVVMDDSIINAKYDSRPKRCSGLVNLMRFQDPIMLTDLVAAMNECSCEPATLEQSLSALLSENLSSKDRIFFVLGTCYHSIDRQLKYPLVSQKNGIIKVDFTCLSNVWPGGAPSFAAYKKY